MLLLLLLRLLFCVLFAAALTALHWFLMVTVGAVVVLFLLLCKRFAPVRRLFSCGPPVVSLNCLKCTTNERARTIRSTRSLFPDCDLTAVSSLTTSQRAEAAATHTGGDPRRVFVGASSRSLGPRSGPARLDLVSWIADRGESIGFVEQPQRVCRAGPGLARAVQ